MSRALLPFFLLAGVVASAGCDMVNETTPPGNQPSTRPVPASVAGPALQVTDVARDYRQLESATKVPAYVDPDVAMMCETASPEQIEAARKRSGPHAMARVMIYMNPLAADAFAHQSAAYPVGSVVVKEKSGADKPAGVGGMIKRAPGYDTPNGDWEYFYFNDPADITQGRIANCVQCHAGAAASDHVFGGWSKRDANPR